MKTKSTKGMFWTGNIKMENFVTTQTHKGKSPVVLTYDGTKLIAPLSSVTTKIGYINYTASSSGTLTFGNSIFSYGINGKDGLFSLNVVIPSLGDNSYGTTFTYDYRSFGNGLQGLGESFLYGLQNAHWEILIGGLSSLSGVPAY